VSASGGDFVLFHNLDRVTGQFRVSYSRATLEKPRTQLRRSRAQKQIGSEVVRRATLLLIVTRATIEIASAFSLADTHLAGSGIRTVYAGEDVSHCSANGLVFRE
jgi:hypothetical protein